MERNSINDSFTSNNSTEKPTELKEELINVNNYSNKTQEKILHLPKGYKVWTKVCVIFGISLVIFIASIPTALATEIPFIFIATGISFIGIFYSFIFVNCCNGFITINPNEAVVYQYYGRYLGTVKDNGYFYGYPLAQIHRISLRSHQYNGNRLKVNERDGNPVELGIVIVWRIGDTAKAIFDVVDYNSFIEAQSEAAIRYVGCKYPYEPIIPGEISLRSGHEIVNKELKKELEKRVAVAGIIIEDARVTEISYGAEIANIMLQKQASNAAVHAKDAIVKGATISVLNSLKEFEKNGIELNNKEKTNYVSEMMNTLCMGSGMSKIMPKT